MKTFELTDEQNEWLADRLEQKLTENVGLFKSLIAKIPRTVKLGGMDVYLSETIDEYVDQAMNDPLVVLYLLETANEWELLIDFLFYYFFSLEIDCEAHLFEPMVKAMSNFIKK